MITNRRSSLTLAGLCLLAVLSRPATAQNLLDTWVPNGRVVLWVWRLRPRQPARDRSAHRQAVYLARVRAGGTTSVARIVRVR